MFNNIINKFIKLESSAGILLLLATLFALILANSPLTNFYNLILTQPVIFHITLEHFINDGLMAIFFFLVSLEIKREIISGELNSWSKASLPMIAALGGIIVPAVIYILLNFSNPKALHGWAIPTATDIAFSLGVLTLLGSKIPKNIKIFLTALAILDDLAAILIIALVYNQNISLLFLLAALLCCLILILFNYFKIKYFWPYGLLGMLLWFFILKSGIHPTIAGVILGFLIPAQLFNLEEKIHPLVAYGILPLFALANAGISFTAVSISNFYNPIFLGIALGLLLGKPIGILTASWLALKSGLAQLPSQVTWRHFFGMSMLCGIGFTMSLFIGLLAFPDNSSNLILVKLGVLTGSILSGLVGYYYLRLSIVRHQWH